MHQQRADASEGQVDFFRVHDRAPAHEGSNSAEGRLMAGITSVTNGLSVA
jgi:hypothetical protein